MAIAFMGLASGKIGEFPSDIGRFYFVYRVPAGKSTVIQSMIFVNTHTETISFSIGVKPRASVFPYAILLDYPLCPGYTSVDDGELTLNERDELHLKVNANAAGKIDFVISGMERTM